MAREIPGKFLSAIIVPCSVLGTIRLYRDFGQSGSDWWWVYPTEEPPVLLGDIEFALVANHTVGGVQQKFLRIF